MSRKRKRQKKSHQPDQQKDPKSGLLARLSAPLASLVALVALLGFFTGTFEKVHHFFTDDMRFVIRTEEFVKGEDHDLIKLRFSLINVSKSNVFVNSLKLRVGDYVTGGPLGTAMIVVKTFDRNLKVTLVRNVMDGSLMTVVGESPSETSMGSTQFSLLGKARISLISGEQVDYNLNIELARPKNLAGKYDRIWDIGGQLIVEYERSNLKGATLRYPRR